MEEKLELKGMLTIQNIREVKEKIITAVSDVQNLSINHDDAEQFDLSYLQLLCSLQKSAEASGKRIKCSFPDSFVHILNETGLSSLKELKGEN